MGQGGRSGGRAGISPRVVARWVLLAAVLAGLFGMHVLTAEGGHGALPQAAMTDHQGMTVTPAVAMTDSAVAPPAIAAVLDADAPGPIATVMRSAGDGLGGHGLMAACVLFLVVGGAALLLALLAASRATQAASTTRPAGVTRGDLRRRGPPGRYRPRVALCVIRI